MPGRAVTIPRAGTVDAVRRLLSPGWVTLHIVVALATVAMLWLGYWQWTGGFGQHTARNTGYALQWWVFAVFAVYFWIKLMRDSMRGGLPPAASARSPLGGLRRPAVPAPAGIREYRPAVAPVVADDSDLGRYNAYLASLDAGPAVPPDSAAQSALPALSAPPVSCAPSVSSAPPAPSVSDDRPAKENP